MSKVAIRLFDLCEGLAAYATPDARGRLRNSLI